MGACVRIPWQGGLSVSGWVWPVLLEMRQTPSSGKKWQHPGRSGEVRFLTRHQDSPCLVTSQGLLSPFASVGGVPARLAVRVKPAGHPPGLEKLPTWNRARRRVCCCPTIGRPALLSTDKPPEEAGFPALFDSPPNPEPSLGLARPSPLVRASLPSVPIDSRVTVIRSMSDERTVLRIARPPFCAGRLGSVVVW